MDLLANDLSVHEQFHDLAGFREALSGLMALRATARRFGRQVQCHRTFLNTAPIPGMALQSVIGNLAVEHKRAVMVWLTRSGPFWDDDVRRHSDDDWLECDGEIVTDTAVGEAAFRTLDGMPCGLVSLTPSEWCRSPLAVTWVRDEAKGLNNRNAEIENWWEAKALAMALGEQAPTLRSWDELREASRSRFADRLIFAEDCFAPLAGVPFAKSAADQFVTLLSVLDRFAGAFDDGGERNAEGHSIYQDYFTGDRARFSDSSDSEKRRFRKKLTFPHPQDAAISLFCSWHGKVRHANDPLRLHFSWPVEAGKRVCIVYAGPKITKR